MSARIVSIGDTRLGMAWVSFDEFVALEGTYARPRITPPMGRHQDVVLHRIRRVSDAQ
jgi:hypothetical protein